MRIATSETELGWRERGSAKASSGSWEKMAFPCCIDTPGVVGRIGTKVGENDVSIAQMNLGRKAEGVREARGIALG